MGGGRFDSFHIGKITRRDNMALVPEKQKRSYRIHSILTPILAHRLRFLDSFTPVSVCKIQLENGEV